MAGKAPLLLAMVLFAIGVSGLALSSAERAQWGPFEGPPPATQQARVIDTGTPFTVPALDTLFASAAEALVQEEPAAPAAVAEPEPEPEPSPTLTPLRVFGLSGDDAGVSAAAADPTPPPLKIVNVASDNDETPEATETPEGTPTPEATETATPGSETPAPTAEPTATETPTPAAN